MTLPTGNMAGRSDGSGAVQGGAVHFSQVRGVGVYVDDIIVSARKMIATKLPVKNQGELRMYIGCRFVRDWESDVLEMNQASFTETLLVLYKFAAKSNILGSPGIKLGPR